MKTSKIVTIYNSLQKMQEKKLPVRLSLILYRNLQKIKSIAEKAEEERVALIREYAEKDDSGNPIDDGGRFHIPDADSFMKEMDELLNTEVDVTFDKLSMKDIERCDEEEKFDSLTMEEIGAIECMIEDE